jgi:hypothetical protein
MKRIILLLFIFMPILSYGQIDKIGYSRSRLISSMEGEPCKNDYDGLWYCSDNGSLIKYTFSNNQVSEVLYMWEFRSKYEADADVKSEISKGRSQYGRPEMKGEQAFWFVDDLLIMISYGFTNGKHYSTWSVAKR